MYRCSEMTHLTVSVEIAGVLILIATNIACEVTDSFHPAQWGGGALKPTTNFQIAHTTYTGALVGDIGRRSMVSPIVMLPIVLL
jgi:hypothetical protein